MKVCSIILPDFRIHLLMVSKISFDINTRCKNAENPPLAEIGANPLAENEFLAFLHFVFPRLYQREKNKKKYAHHYNRCKIRRGIQIRCQNRVTIKRKVGKCGKLSENHKIAWRKKRCEKIPSAPITIWKSIKKGNFWRLIDALKPASVLVITVFLFSVFWISRLFLYQ